MKLKNIKYILIFLSLHQTILSANHEFKNTLISTKNIDKSGISIIKDSSSQELSDNYILDKGDSLIIDFLGVPEFSGIYNINLDGNIYLPRLKLLNVSGYTIPQLKDYLEKRFEDYLLEPDISIKIATYRPIRVYVGGEVSRPGFYTLSNYQSTSLRENNMPDPFGDIESSIKVSAYVPPSNSTVSNPLFFPTVFDAIQKAEGITPFSDISRINIERIIPEVEGGGKKKAMLNFLSLILDGDDGQNIRLYDGDSIFVDRTDNVVVKQILKAGQTNLNPRFITVFISGRVIDPGRKQVPTGSSLNNLIALSGGTKKLKGKIEFIRFTNEGKLDRRQFNFSPRSKTNSYKNPILRKGDIVRVRESFITASLGVVTEVTSPFVNVFSVYGFFDNFFDD